MTQLTYPDGKPMAFLWAFDDEGTFLWRLNPKRELCRFRIVHQTGKLITVEHDPFDETAWTKKCDLISKRGWWGVSQSYFKTASFRRNSLIREEGIRHPDSHLPMFLTEELARRARDRVLAEDAEFRQRAREAAEKPYRHILEESERIRQEWQKFADTITASLGPCPFAALGLAPNATVNDVKSAYYRLAKLHHPDTGGNADEFVKIEEAYRRALAATKP